MAARRTQIYLTDEQRRRLDVIRQRDRRSLAEVIREALDAYLEGAAPDPEEALEATRGALPKLEPPSRAEWDRGYG